MSQMQAEGASIVQYADGSIVATPTGSALMFQDTGNAIRVVSATHPLPTTTVGTVTISGTVTANAGTNLNTSLLATEVTLAAMNDTTTISSGLLSNINDTLVNQAGSLQTLGAAAHEEDGPHTTGEVGMFMLGVRNSTLSTTFTSANNDYNPIATDGRGAVWVMPGVTGVDLGKAEDAAHTTGDTGVFALAVRNDGAVTAFTNANGDYSPISVSATGEVFIVGQRAEDAAHTTGDRGIFTLGVRNDTGADTTNANGDYSQFSVDVGGNMRNVGNVDHDAADKGSPIKVGFRASTTNRTRVASGDRADALSDTAGRQINVPFQVRELVGDATVTLANNTETTIVAATASTFYDLVEVTVTNTGAVTLNVSLRSTTGGAVRRIIQVPAGDTVQAVFPATLKQAAVNTNWTVQSSSATGDCTVGVSYIANI